jgi:hypothetical protein
MLSAKLSEIPAYLQHGELFQILKQNENADAELEETILVPINCSKRDTSVDNNHDLSHLLHTLRYWAVSDIPDSVLEYLTRQACLPIEDLGEIAVIFPIVSAILALKEHPQEQHLTIAARRGELHLMVLLRSRGYHWKHTECYVAAHWGHLACLKYAHEQGCKFRTEDFPTWPGARCACNEGFHNGHVECFKYAHEHGCPSLQVDDCAGTSVACIEYLLDRPSEFGIGGLWWRWKSIGLAAARLGSITCLEKARCLGWRMSGTYSLFESALHGNHPGVLEYVIKGGCPLGDNAADTLIDSGRTDIVGMLFDRGVILNARSLRKLLQRGQFEFLREAIDRGRCSTTTFATEAVAEALQVDLLNRAFQQGFQRSARICMSAVAAGNLAVLQCAVEHGCPLDWKACMSAAGGGHLSCLQYIVGRGAPVPLRALPAAVRGGHLPCLRYLNEQGGRELTTALVFLAIGADSVLCVRYLHEHGCYLDSAVGARRAATVGSLSCFQYYHEQAGPQRLRTRAWDTVWEAARKSKSGSVREYAQRHG